jgi:biotin carboxyl carrier protein
LVNAALAAGVVVAGGTLYLVLRPAGETSTAGQNRTAQVSRGAVQATVSAQEVAFATVGEVAAINVAVGSAVTEGQELAVVDGAGAGRLLRRVSAEGH